MKGEEGQQYESNYTGNTYAVSELGHESVSNLDLLMHPDVPIIVTMSVFGPRMKVALFS